MADRILTWHIHGVLSETGVVGVNTAEAYVADDDYVPIRVHLQLADASSGDPLIVDINDDGSSIFGTLKPTIGWNSNFVTMSVFGSGPSVISKDSVITLDIDQVSGSDPGSDLTVHLELDKV